MNEISPIFTQLEGLHRKYARGRDSLTIACNHDISIQVMPRAMAQYSQKSPSVQLTLHVGNSTDIEELLLTGKVDVAVITNFSMLSPSLFTMEPFPSERLVPFVGSNHPLARRGRTQSARIGHICFVIRSRRDGQSRTETELSRLAQRGIELRIAMRCESAETVKEAVKQGAGVGILYHDVIKREIDRGEFKILNLPGFDAVGHRYIVYSKESPLSAHATEFLSLLRASVMQKQVTETPVAHVRFGASNGHQKRISSPRSKFL